MKSNGSTRNSSIKADSWDKERRVVAKIEWPPGELLPKFGFIVTNMKKKPEEVVEFYNKRGTAELYIKEGKRTFNWTAAVVQAVS